MSRKNLLIVLVALLSVLNLLGTIALYRQLSDADTPEGAAKYTMYVGLNDKEQYEQLISDEAAQAIIEAVCAKYADGVTLQEATGMWTDDSGAIMHEKTFVCSFCDTDEAVIRQIADELLVSLNQSCVLIEKSFVTTEYYAGGEPPAQ